MCFSEFPGHIDWQWRSFLLSELWRGRSLWIWPAWWRQACLGDGWELLHSPLHRQVSILVHVKKRNPTEIQSLNYFKSSICATRVKQILKRHDPHTPLFIYLSLQAAHTPLQVPDHFLHLYDSQCNRLRRHSAAMLSCLDSGVAQVVQELKTQGLYENSLLIYSSDKGGQPL